VDSGVQGEGKGIPQERAGNRRVGTGFESPENCMGMGIPEEGKGFGTADDGMGAGTRGEGDRSGVTRAGTPERTS
jgi:hypothetical protein